MTKPQQPELRRSERGATDADSVKATAKTSLPPDEHPNAPVPPENRPGHRPEEDQDKPAIGDAD